MIFLWVDDLLIASSPHLMPIIKRRLSETYKIEDRWPLTYSLGFKIQRDRTARSVSLSAPNYVSDILTFSNMLDCAPLSIPMDPSLNFQSEASPPVPTGTPDRRIAGQFLHLCITTRPDIAVAVGVLCRYNSKPLSIHWNAMKRLIRYLKGTMHYGIVLSGSLELIGWSDANWATNTENRRSTSGYLFQLGSAPISWSTKPQNSVALSTCEAEYIAMAAAAQEAIWLTDLLNDIGISQPSMIIKEDNQAAIELTKNTRNHSRTKHIDIRFHFLKDLVLKKSLKVIYCPTAEMIADIFTKPLSTSTFTVLRTLLGVHDLTTSISGFRGSVEINPIMDDHAASCGNETPPRTINSFDKKE